MTDMPRPGYGLARHLGLLLARCAVAVALLGAWEALSRFVVDPFWIGRPSAIAAVLGRWLNDGNLLRQVTPTLTETGVGFVAGTVAGVVAGAALGYFRLLGSLLRPFITAIYTLPKIALAPLILLWLGIGFQAKAGLSALLVFFLVFYNTYAGIREVDPDLINAARLMGGSRGDVFRFVYLPHAASWVFAGLRLALPYALVGAVVGEMLASNSGIGYLLANATNQFDTSSAFAALFILVVIGLAITGLVSLVEGRVQRWQPQRLDRSDEI